MVSSTLKPNIRCEFGASLARLSLIRSGHLPDSGRYIQECPIELASAEEIDERELSNHQASGGQKQTALTMVDLDYSAQPMKPIYVNFLNVRIRYKECVFRPSNIQAETINPRLALRSVRFQAQFIPDVEEYLTSKHSPLVGRDLLDIRDDESVPPKVVVGYNVPPL